jgi:hypothetical protein
MRGKAWWSILFLGERGEAGALASWGEVCILGEVGVLGEAGVLGETGRDLAFLLPDG